MDTLININDKLMYINNIILKEIAGWLMDRLDKRQTTYSTVIIYLLGPSNNNKKPQISRAP